MVVLLFSFALLIAGERLRLFASKHMSEQQNSPDSYNQQLTEVGEHERRVKRELQEKEQALNSDKNLDSDYRDEQLAELRAKYKPVLQELNAKRGEIIKEQMLNSLKPKK